MRLIVINFTEKIAARFAVKPIENYRAAGTNAASIRLHPGHSIKFKRIKVTLLLRFHV